MIASIGYSQADEILEVEFQNGRIYQYDGVPAAKHVSLLSADSVGAYFNKNIRDQYRSRYVSTRDA